MSTSPFDILCRVAAAEAPQPTTPSTQQTSSQQIQQHQHQHTLPPLRNLPTPSTSNTLPPSQSHSYSHPNTILHRQPTHPPTTYPHHHHQHQNGNQHLNNNHNNMNMYSYPTTTPISSQPQFRLSSSAPSHGGILGEGNLTHNNNNNNTIPPHPTSSHHQQQQLQPKPLSIPATANGAYSVPRDILNPAPILSPLYPTSTSSTLQRNLSAPSLSEGGINNRGSFIPRTRRIPVPTGSRAPLPSMLSGSPGTGIGSPNGCTLSPNINALSPPVYGSSPPLGVSSLTRGRIGNNNGYNGPGGMKSINSRSSGKSSGRRDSYTRFTNEEENMLMDGVRLFGVGNWKKILTSYKFHGKRTAVDLKDKYRNMTRAKLRKMNASSQSDLSSVGSDDNSSNRREMNSNTQAMSPLQGGFLSKDDIIGISPVTTANTTPAGSIEERAVAMGAMTISKSTSNGMSR